MHLSFCLSLPVFGFWVVREGLSVVLHQQCFKSLLQATASAFKYSYLTHPSWEQEKRLNGWTTLAASHSSNHLVRQLHIALDSMKTLVITSLLAMWLVAAVAWTSASRVIARSLPDKDLNGYISDHSESRRDVVGASFITSSLSTTAKHLWQKIRTYLIQNLQILFKPCTETDIS